MSRRSDPRSRSAAMKRRTVWAFRWHRWATGSVGDESASAVVCEAVDSDAALSTRRPVSALEAENSRLRRERALRRWG